ncbi:hypothetical protein Tco_1326675 [Tanacetum coccineum]
MLVKSVRNLDFSSNIDSSTPMETNSGFDKGKKMCKKQTVVANSTTEAEYIAASHCYGQVVARLGANETTLGMVDAQTSIAIAKTSANGEVELTATIDGQVKTITEASLRRHLKLEDNGGITTLPNSEIFEQLALMGMKEHHGFKKDIEILGESLVDDTEGGYKMRHFNGMSYEDSRPIFEKVWDQNHSFVPMDSELEIPKLKRAEPCTRGSHYGFLNVPPVPLVRALRALLDERRGKQAADADAIELALYIDSSVVNHWCAMHTHFRAEHSRLPSY